MKPSPTAVFLLGLWLGGSFFLVGVAAYNFTGIESAFEANEKLAARAGFDPRDEAAKKTSVLWVYSSELNRKYFTVWNRIQLGLGLVVVLIIARRFPRAGPMACASFALGVVAALTFYFAPRLITLGRALDFVPRTPEPAGFARFARLHQTYSTLESLKIVLLLAAFLWIMVSSRVARRS